MLFLRKIFIYLLSLSNLLLFFLLIYKPEKNIYWLGLFIIFLFFLNRLASGNKLSLKQLLYFFSFSLIFSLVSVIFLSLLENIILSYIFIFFINLFLLFYFIILYTYVYRPEDYLVFSLVNFISYLSFWIFYSLFTVSYVFVNVLNASIWLVAVLLVIFSLTILAYNFSVENLSIKKNWRYFLVYSCLIGELSWLIAWLPWNYFVKGFCLATIAYFVLYYIIKKIKHDWLAKNFIWQTAVLIFLMIVIVATTRWF
ncbi:MAG TPA: hypothetical protein PLK76_01080 [bacterium]|nr:hypothetical protein [bacterium]